MTELAGKAGEATRIRLLDLPVALVVAAEGQWKALLREYVLRGFGGAVQAYGPTEVTRAGAALDAVAAGVLQVDAPSGIGDGTGRANVEVELAGLTPGDFGILQAVLDDAVQLSQNQELLVMPPLPEVIALRNWFCGEAIAQASGADPTPWKLRDHGAHSDAISAVWDGAIEPDTGAWLIGDDHNRIVAASGPCLDLLGWRDRQLVGQRLLAVIPPAYREVHLAAFTRNVVEGSGRLLGIPLHLPALRSDGTEIPVTLTLTRHRAAAGRTVFLGVLQPR